MTQIPLPRDANASTIPVFKVGGTELTAVDGSSASAQSAVIDATNECVVRVTVSADCYLAFGADPTATSANMRMWSKTTEYFVIPAGYKIACLGAVLRITKLAG